MASPTTPSDSYPLGVLSTKASAALSPSLRGDDKSATLVLAGSQPSITVDEDERLPSGGQLPPKSDALTDWDGPADPENPKNWSLGLRIYHTMLPALYGFSV